MRVNQKENRSTSDYNDTINRANMIVLFNIKTGRPGSPEVTS